MTVAALILGSVAATLALGSAIPGNASADLATTAIPKSVDTAVTASFAQSSDQREVLGTQLKTSTTLPDAPGDNLLLAVLSLESATTPAEATASMQRIVSLGVPQAAPSVATLSELVLEEAEPTQESELAVASPTPEPEEAPECRETSSPAYCVYTVVTGDTLSGIAQHFGFSGNGDLSAADMLAESNKPDVISSDHIEPGQNIRVPSEPGILHTVLFAETAAELAVDYGVSLSDILTSPYNALGGDGVLYIGQEVFIPNPTQLPVNEDAQVVFDEPTPEPTAASEPEPTIEPTQAPEPTATEEPVILPDAPRLGPLPTETPTPDAEEPTATSTPPSEATPAPTATSSPNTGSVPRNSSLFVWPTSGPISSYFGPSHPLGIDIDLYGDPNADIVAARGGTVVFAGGDPCCSYGNYVIVDHGNGVQTLYAHLSEIVVSEGEEVSQGGLLGYGGRTGYATGNHLHFEIRVNGNVVDPLFYLP